MLPLCCEWKKTQNMLQSGLGHSVSLPQELSWPCTCFEGGDLQLWVDCPKSCTGCVCKFIKAVVVVPKQLGPAQRIFHLKSWAGLFRAVWVNHFTLLGRGGTYSIEPGSSKTGDHTLGGFSMGCGEKQWIRLWHQITCWRKRPLFFGNLKYSIFFENIWCGVLSVTGLDNTVLNADLFTNRLSAPLWIVLRKVVLSASCGLACGMTFAHKGKLWIFSK